VPLPSITRSRPRGSLPYRTELPVRRSDSTPTAQGPYGEVVRKIIAGSEPYVGRADPGQLIRLPHPGKQRLKLQLGRSSKLRTAATDACEIRHLGNADAKAPTPHGGRSCSNGIRPSRLSRVSAPSTNSGTGRAGPGNQPRGPHGPVRASVHAQVPSPASGSWGRAERPTRGQLRRTRRNRAELAQHC
jgi:hypothetical protein